MQISFARLLRFLVDQRVTSQLGGIVVEVCTFPNDCKAYHSDALRDAQEENIEMESKRNTTTTSNAPIFNFGLRPGDGNVFH